VISDLLTSATDDDETKAVELVESLSFALRVASLTSDEYKSRVAVVEDYNVEEESCNVAHRLALLMAEDQRLRTERGDHHQPTAMMQQSLHLFPETTRWCLSALRNLTKSTTRNGEVAHILIQSSILPLILQFITVADSSSVAETSFVNTPSSWYSNSIQDTALAIVMNLSACSSSREYMNDMSTIKTLSEIVGFPGRLSSDGDMGDGEKWQMRFQCLKAVSCVLCFLSLCYFCKG
jgi:hypothetical protein